MRMLIETILSFSLIVNGVMAYGLFNLLWKYEIYEEWVTFFRSEIHKLNERVKQADVIHTPGGDSYRLFESDDDVGFIFSEIQRIINEFNERIK